MNYDCPQHLDNLAVLLSSFITQQAHILAKAAYNLGHPTKPANDLFGHFKPLLQFILLWVSYNF